MVHKIEKISANMVGVQSTTNKKIVICYIIILSSIWDLLIIFNLATKTPY